MDTLIHVIEDTIASYLKSKVYENALMLAKGVAVLFVLMEITHSYIKNIRDKNSLGFKFYDMVKPMGYILLICCFTSILEFFETITHEFFTKIESGEPMYQILLQAIKETTKTDVNEPKLASVFPTPSMIIKIIGEFLIKVTCFAIGVIDIIIYSVFIAERSFLLGVSTLLFPFFLAFSALNKFKDYITKAIKIYLVVLVSIYIIALVMNVGELLFKNIKVLLSGGNEIMRSEFTSTSICGDFGAVLVAGIIVTALKIKLLKVGMTHLYRVMT